MLIEAGEKVHVITRRTIESQVRAHFVGEITAAEGAVVRASGYVFIYDDSSGNYVRKQSERTTILNLAESGYVVNVIPRSVDIANLRYENSERGDLQFTDGAGFRLNINEFGVRR